MANETIRARIEVLLKGLDQVESLKNAVRQLQTTAAPASADLQKLKNAAMQLGGASSRTENDLRRSISALKDVRAQLSLTDREYQRLTGTINKYQAQLDRATGAQQQSGRGMRFAQTAGAVAASGVFGGPEGLIGAGIGAFFGPGGALAGGAIGAQVGMARQQIGLVAQYVSTLNLAKTTLAQASSGQAEYNRLLESARKISADYSVGLKETLTGYSQVAVAAKANGLSLKETENIYRGVVAAGVAFGKSQEDLDAIITATVQVLSKGKLSAEELQGQIGERLPGAVAKFAAATGRSLPQLSKDLEQGKVTIADFVKFTERQLKDYDQIAKIIGDSPEKAGARLQIALDSAAETYGGLFQLIGAGLQDNVTQLLGWLNQNEQTIKEWVTAWVNAGRDIIYVIKSIGEVLGPIVTGFADLIKRFYEFMQYNPGVALGNMVRGGIKGIFGTEPPRPLTPDQVFPEFKPGAFGSSSGAPGKGDLDTDALEKAAKAQLKAQLDLQNRLREAAERNAEQLADLREQSIKRAADLERDLGDQRLQLERSIAESRRRTAEQEEDLLLERERQRLAAAGLSTAGVDAQQRLLEISRRYSEQRIQNEEAAVDRQTQLQRQIEEFKAGVADSIGKLQEGYARSVADILQSAGDKLAESMVTGAQKAAGLIAGAPPAPILPPPGSQVGASTLTAGAVQGGKVGVGTLVGLAKAAGFSDRDARIMAAIAMAESSRSSRALNNNPRTGDLSYGLWQINMMGRMGPERRRSFGIGSNDALYDPATNANAARQIFQSQGFNAWSVYRSGAYRQYLPGAMGAIPNGVPAAPGGFNPSSIMGGIRKQGGQLGLASETEKAAQNQKAFNQMLSEYTKEFGSYKQELDAATASGRDQLETQTRMYELLKSGVNPEIARQRAETEVMANKEIERLEKLYNQLGVELQNTELTEKQRSNLEQLRSEVDGRLASEQSIVDAIQAQAEQLEALEKNNRLATYVNQLQQQLEDLTNIQSVLITIGQTVESEISGAMSTAVTSVVTGSGSIKQALSDMFANIGQSFIKMATDIIAKQLVMITLQTILKALGLGLSGGSTGGGVDRIANFNAGVAAYGFADGGIMTSRGPVPLKKYARGGIANSPQMALFGEGSTPEAFVPLPDGRRIPVSLKSQDKMNEIMGRSPVQQQSPTLNMTFQTTNIGGVEYVSRDQLEAAMTETRKAASRDGAKRGMSMTLDRLQQSPTTRRQVGLR